MGQLSDVHPAVKTERDIASDYERMVHAYQWSIVLSYSKILARLGRPFPAELLRRLLDVYVKLSGDPTAIEGGQRIDYDPTGGFRRARPAAVTLRAALDGWDGGLPAPQEAVTAAREMVTAHGHSAAGRWDEHDVPDDAWDQLLWPDEGREASSVTGGG